MDPGEDSRRKGGAPSGYQGGVEVKWPQTGDEILQIWRTRTRAGTGEDVLILVCERRASWVLVLELGLWVGLAPRLGWRRWVGGVARRICKRCNALITSTAKEEGWDDTRDRGRAWDWNGWKKQDRGGTSRLSKLEIIK